MRKSFAAIAIAGPLAVLCGVTVASAQAPPPVGAAQSYAVLAGTTAAVNGTGSVINGNIGVSPGTAITGLPGGGTVVPPFSQHSNDSSAIAAQSATGTLYTALVNFGGTPASGTPHIPELGNDTLGPGTYIFSSTANIAAGQPLTLSGAGTYVFKVGSSLTANVGSSILLLNGASPCNIFWQITADATLNGATFSGTVVAQSSVTLGVGATLNGRALATSLGAVTLSGTNTVGGCSNAGGCPAITIAPPTLPNGTIGVPYAQTITASGGTAPYTFTVTTGTLPAGLTLTTAGVLAGTPTAGGTNTFTVTAVDANGCFASIIYTISIFAAVPTLPQIFVLLLAAGLFGIGYLRLRQRAGPA